MTKYIVNMVAVALLLLATSCASSRLTDEEKAERAKQYAEEIYQALKDSHFAIDVSFMQPLSGPLRSVNGVYGIVVKGDTLQSALPYVGAAVDLPYGGGKGLNFDSLVESYQVTYSNVKKCYNIDLVTKSEGDMIWYNINVYNNGKSDMSVNSNRRTMMRYSGEIDLKPRK